jgi:tetratricopeptide (TPR) repeat protein
MLRLLLRRGLASIPSQEAKVTSNIVQAQKMFNEGIELWNKDDLIGAQKCFEKSISILPTSDAYYNLANVFHNQGQFSKSLENWKKSLEQTPRADAHVNIANILALANKDFESAYEHYEKALKLDPEDGETHYNYAVVLDQGGKLEKAIEEYSIAVSCGIVQAENTLRNARARWVGEKAKLEKS